MIINAHTHLHRKELTSEKAWDYAAGGLSKKMGIPKDIIKKNQSAYFNSTIHHAEALVNVLDNAGIDKAIITAMDLGLSASGEPEWTIEKINRWIADQANQYPGILFPLCSVDPRRGISAIQLIEKAISEWGMKGIKIHPAAGFYPDSPEFFSLYEKCLELNVPLYSHVAPLTPILGMSKYTHPIYLDTIAANFPDLKIIMIHFGGLSWTSECVEIMCSKPNVYAEISGNQIAARINPQKWLNILRNILDTPTMIGTSIGDRIIFGSDWPFLEYAMKDSEWVEWIKNIPENSKQYGLEFNDQEIKKILGNNAEKILNL